MEDEHDGNQLQFKVMMSQLNEHSGLADGPEVLASIKTEIEQTISKLKQDKILLDKAFKADTLELSRACKKFPENIKQ